jgi:hypothetical protein
VTVANLLILRSHFLSAGPCIKQGLISKNICLVTMFAYMQRSTHQHTQYYIYYIQYIFHMQLLLNKCISFYAFLSMHLFYAYNCRRLILCISFYLSNSIYLISIALYNFNSLHLILCIICGVSQSIHASHHTHIIVCIFFYALHYKHLILYILYYEPRSMYAVFHYFISFDESYSMHLNICNTSFFRAIQYQESSIARQYQCNTNAILDAVKYVIKFC